MYVSISTEFYCIWEKTLVWISSEIFTLSFFYWIWRTKWKKNFNLIKAQIVCVCLKCDKLYQQQVVIVNLIYKEKGMHTFLKSISLTWTQTTSAGTWTFVFFSDLSMFSAPLIIRLTLHFQIHNFFNIFQNYLNQSWTFQPQVYKYQSHSEITLLCYCWLIWSRVPTKERWVFGSFYKTVYVIKCFIF